MVLSIKSKWCHTNQHKTLIILNFFAFWKYAFLFFDKCKFDHEMSCLCCVLGYILMFWMFLWDSVSFSVYMNIFKNIYLFFRTFEMFGSSKAYCLIFSFRKWFQMVPPPILIPIPSVSKHLLPGGKEKIKKTHSMISMRNVKTRSLPGGGLKRGPQLKKH